MTRVTRWTQWTSKVLLAAGVLAGAGLLQAAPVFDRMVLFGDSLSDTGNTRNVVGAGSGLVANLAGYGSNSRFSNGPLWHETLAPLIGVPVNTASRSSGANNYNYAYGGARVDNATGASAGVLTQYADYSARVGAAGSNPNSLYVVWAGGNDVRDLVGNANPLPGITSSINALQSVLTGLISSGANTFLIPNLPDLGMIPENRGKTTQASATSATQLWNSELLAMVMDLTDQASFYFLDVYSEFNALLANPASYGFTNTTGQCRSLGLLGFIENSCSNPSAWAFWDAIHPTTAAHAVLGRAAAAVLNGAPLQHVPEPQSLWLVVLGVAIALGLRRRGQRPVAAPTPGAWMPA
ncbi:MAG: SGNH/GDSL hydrolase family protein [Rhodoferax sp.]|nr:SGNH/GDSL hydrolase family protein [Rhodoferax sp.]